MRLLKRLSMMTQRSKRIERRKVIQGQKFLTSTWSEGRDIWKTTSREQPKGGGQANQVKLYYKLKASEQPIEGNHVKPHSHQPSIIQ